MNSKLNEENLTMMGRLFLLKNFIIRANPFFFFFSKVNSQVTCYHSILLDGDTFSIKVMLHILSHF
jgi:hypothetical protein